MSLTPVQIQSLIRRHSPYWVRQMEAHPKDLKWLREGMPLGQPRSLRRMEIEWKSLGWEAMTPAEAFEKLHEVKRREMLRITVRDLGDLSPLTETVTELSALADYCLQRGLDRVMAEMVSRHGAPAAAFAVFGMGKLGGQELNYSSDIDLIFVYSEEGKVGRITHHAFFTRVAERLVEGFRASGTTPALFRVDLRLRPEGNSGPIVRSLESYENYYAAFGEAWERIALQKARLVAGDAELGYEFLQHMQPFCFPKHLSPSALGEIFQIKNRIETEIVKEGGMDRHVKLGRGGIREIEFGVQALQLLHGARHAFSRERGTMKSLQALQRMGFLKEDETVELTRAYIFLRRLEHRLQMCENQQTHVVPEDLATQTELGKGLGFKGHKDFVAEWKSHTERVRTFFVGIVQPAGTEMSDTFGAAALPFDWRMGGMERDRLLRQAGFQDFQRAGMTLQTLSEGPDYAHVSQRTKGFFQQLTPHLFRVMPGLAQPDLALEQLERFIEVYGSRAALYELLASNPKVLELLLKLFDQGQFLTDVLMQQPDLLEAIAFGGMLQGVRTREDMATGLREELSGDLAQKLRLFYRSQVLRIGLRDILGLTTSPVETWSQMGQLADVCLVETLSGGGGKFTPGFCVIGLGKYGGGELSYGSDLDVLFVGGSVEQARRVIALLSQESADGAVFKMDARLRPDGEDGLLAVPLEAYQSYYGKRAQLWERQALTRARVAGGDPKVGIAFLKMVDELIYARPASAAELKEIWAMRIRIEKERGDGTDPARDFKTGAGGLVDIEFLAQTRQLLHGCREVGLRRASTLAVLNRMSEVEGWKTSDLKLLMDGYFWLRTLEAVLRRGTDTGVSQLPESRVEWTPVARHLGLKTGAELEKELSRRRKVIRECVKRLWNGSDVRKS